MALLLTLAIIALLSGLLVSFVSITSQDRGASKNYAQSLIAEQVALSGLDQIVSQVRAEIADPRLAMNSFAVANGVTNNLYIPLSSSNAVPQHMGPNLPNLATLVSYSGTNLYTMGGGATNYSSRLSTQSGSLNGRSISTARWNKPLLLADTTGFPAPQWVLMTRGGPKPVSTYAPALADSSPANTDYVVGRYAYVVYDTSGLLDANVAGYPSGSDASLKGLLPWADLTQLTNGITAGDVDQFVKWRNAATAVNATSYAAGVYASATNNGFTRVTNGDTSFLSRQELIKYVQTQNPDLTNALPYLTTFSREVNGPTWGPSTNFAIPYAYASQQYTAQSYNPRLSNPRVQGAFPNNNTRNNGTPAVVGEPLVKYRFPLDKLALLEKAMGKGRAGLSSDEVETIQKYFGLDLAGDFNGPSYRHWVYPTASTKYKHGVGSGTTGIMTLDDVAAQNREPDFFELLQAGMLYGSLGVPGKKNPGDPLSIPNPGRGDQYPITNNGQTDFIDPDDLVTLQVLRIGANMMDQWDADSFPTTITFSPSTGPINVYGIEDLPYPFAAFLNTYAPTANTVPINFYLSFEMWNPHQVPTGAVDAANYPTGYQLSPLATSNVNDSDTYMVAFSGLVPLTATAKTTDTNPATFKSGVWYYNGKIAQNTPTDLFPASSPQVVGFTAASTGAGSYREPSLIAGSTAGAPSPLDKVACFASPPALTAFPDWKTKSNEIGGNTSTLFPNPAWPNWSSITWQVKVVMSIGMRAQYKDGDGVMRTYAMFMGLDENDPAIPTYSHGTGYQLNGIVTPYSGAVPVPYGVSMIKSDPRTFRLGAGFNTVPSTTTANHALSDSAGSMWNPVNGSPPFGSYGPGVSSKAPVAPYRIDMWAANDSTGPLPSPNSGNPAYADIDGVKRWGDARHSYKLGSAASPLFASAGTAGTNPARPVMLNHPFHSVGDLGYVFRDMAWKTLDLFSPDSADAALLDLFTLSDAPVVAGRVNPNTPYPQVLAALISGGAQSTIGATSVSASTALAVGKALHDTTVASPLLNRADLVSQFMTNSVMTTSLATSGIKSEIEAPVRALAESSNTRTWNFLVDIISQSGRYPSTAGKLEQFMVDGQRRYWLSIAVDRYTGEIVGKQLEMVDE